MLSWVSSHILKQNDADLFEGNSEAKSKVVNLSNTDLESNIS